MTSAHDGHLPYATANARLLEPWDVARSFVPPESFLQIAQDTNTLLIGPRGSGKTTLLKMLQTPALETWSHPLSDDVRQRVSYCGVFIPIDRSWSSQIEALADVTIEGLGHPVLGAACLTSHILRAFVGALRDRIRPPVKPLSGRHLALGFSPAQEAAFVSLAADSWSLESVIPTLGHLRQALSTRISRILQLSRQLKLVDEGSRGRQLSEIGYLHLTFSEALVAGLDSLEAVLESPAGKWALLFDELEIAPAWLRRTLMESLRRADSRLRFKLAVSPVTKELQESVYSAMPGHDFDPVRLWYPRKEESFPFCERLVESMLAARGFRGKSAEDVFGKSSFDYGDDSHRTRRQAYGRGGAYQVRFESLARKDSSFKDYLAGSGLDLGSLDRLTESERAEEVRRMGAIVTVREAFRRDDAVSTAGLRSRKNPELYRGAKTLFAVSEGNPRLLIGIVGRLFDQSVLGGVEVLRRLQSVEQRRAAARFRSFLKSVPCPPLRRSQRPRGALSLITTLGVMFASRILKEPFSPEPPGSFLVDADTDPELLETLDQAINAGALVYVPDKDSALIMEDVRGKRFRLSYLLAHEFKLPLILLRPTSLGALLRSSERDQVEQQQLFDEGSRS